MRYAVRSITVGDEFSIREEENGVTVYEKAPHLMNFFEHLSLRDIEESVKPLDARGLRAFLEGHREMKSTNVTSTYPFYIGWEVSGACNLDCIYCFAEDVIHTKNTKDILATAEQIMSLHPLSVGLSGGEPTLNPLLPEVMKLFSGNTAMVLNTNGTTKQLEKLVPLLKQTNTLVRLTIDSFDNDLLNTLRPPRSMPKSGYDQISVIKHNVGVLLDAHIPFMVHTVLTQKNIGATDQIAEGLIELGVERWHMYSVDKSKKCQSFFDQLEVTKEQMRSNHEHLIARYGDRIEITSALNDLGFRERAVLLIDSTGRFFVHTATDGPRFIGKNPLAPTIGEIHEAMDYETHKRCYLQNFWN